MKKVSDISVAVIDHGQFIPIARKLAEQCGEVFYYSQAERSLPLLQEGIIGDGFPELKRIRSPFAVKPDLYVFPDIGFETEQRKLIDDGFPVWGCREYGNLEANRGQFLSTLKQLEMKTPRYKTVLGLTKLRDHLKDTEDKYIKISKWRGDFETFHWNNWDEDEPALDQWSVRFGPAKEQITFYVFDPIDSVIEDGVDSYCVDGKWPSLVLHGPENKDKSYIGCMTRWKDLPDFMRKINEDFGTVLTNYRGAFSTEVRGEIFTDATCRFGSPPHQVQTEIWENFSDIIWQGANGRLIDPIPAADFGVQALLTTHQDGSDWASFTIPDEIKQWVKAGFCCEINGKLVFPPHPLKDMAGYLVAIGDTPAEAITRLLDYKELLPNGLECHTKSIADLLIELDKAQKHGIEFTDEEIPEPSIVLET